MGAPPVALKARRDPGSVQAVAPELDWATLACVRRREECAAGTGDDRRRARGAWRVQARAARRFGSEVERGCPATPGVRRTTAGVAPRVRAARVRTCRRRATAYDG